MAEYAEDKNTGLPTNFTLVNGAFGLVGGTKKSDDNMRMLVGFIGWFRIFTQDYVPNLLWLYQRESSFVNRFKSIARLNFLESAQKYAPFVDVYAVDVQNNPKDRKNLFVDISFRYKLSLKKTYTSVRYIRTL